MHKGKGKGKGKGAEVVFDDRARAEYLTGFRKRKQERKQAGRDYLAKKAKEEQLAARKELRQARREKAAENVREQRKAFGLEAEGESDIDPSHNDNDDSGDEGSGEEVPEVREEEYDSDEHHTHVIVETFDPDNLPLPITAVAEARKPNANVTPSTPALASVESLPPSSRRVNKAKANASEGEETRHAHQEENGAHQQQFTQRLHVSGLTDAFSKEDLVRRFSTFGTVLSLDGLGQIDAVGQVRPFAYLTLRAPASQIKRCINVLSGSVWKGATLRIGEAKPDYAERIKGEQLKRKQEEEGGKAKKARRGTAVESKHMEPVDEKTVEAGLAWGWKRTPAGHLVRPLRMRPPHPLPKPSRVSTLQHLTAHPGDPGEEGESKVRRERVNPRPPSKAHRITIDPTRYGSVHLSGALLDSLYSSEVAQLGAGQWHCEELSDDSTPTEGNTVRLVRWCYTAKDGEVLHEEFTKLPVRVSQPKGKGEEEGDVVEQLDFDQYAHDDDDGDLFSGFPSTFTPAQPAAEAVAQQSGAAQAVDTTDIDDLFNRPSSSVQANDLFSDFPNAPQQSATIDTTDIDDLFAKPSTSSHPVGNVNDLFSDFPTPQPKRTKVEASKPAKGKGTFVPGLDPEEEEFSDGYDETLTTTAPAGKQAASAQEERSKTLALLGEMFGDTTSELDGEVAEIEAEDASSSDSDSNSEAVEQESSSSSSSSSSSDSQSGDAEEEEDEAEGEREGDVEMAEAPTTVAEVVAMDAKSRRAAFLSSLAEPNVAKGSYVPIARFDPGSLTTSSPAPEPSAAPAPAAAAEVAPSPTPVAAAPEPEGTHVSMSTLKQMFQPADRPSTTGFSLGLDSTNDTSAGFSLMDSLGLEFELEDEEPLPEPSSSFAPSHSTFPRFTQQPTPQTEEKQQKSHPFFPTSAKGWNGQASTQRWMKPRTQEEREKDWAKYKDSLTPAVKKRHREAARKHKRNFRSVAQPTTSSRA